jgi:hypothetical protein
MAWCAVVAGVLSVAGVRPADAGLTVPACLAKKQREWGTLRKCQAVENATALQGRPANQARCQTSFTAKLVALNALATATGIACR